MAQPGSGLTSSTMSGDVAGDRSAKVGGICGIVFGIVVIAFFFSFLLGPQNQTAEQSLASFGTYRNLAIVQGSLSVLIALFSIPYFLSMRDALKAKDRTLASAASTFSIVAFVLIASIDVVSFAIQTAMSDVYATGTAQDKAAAVVVMTAVGSLSFLPLSSAAFGAGLLLYGIAVRGSRTFPNWAGYVGIVAGLVLFVSIVPVSALGFVTFLVSFVLLLVWLFASSFYLWRSAGRSAVSST